MKMIYQAISYRKWLFGIQVLFPIEYWQLFFEEVSIRIHHYRDHFLIYMPWAC